MSRPLTEIEPTSHAEWTIAGIIIFTGFMSLLLLSAMVWGKLQDPVAKYIGIGFWICMGAMVVGLLIFITSKCGSRVKVAAGGAEVEIGGDKSA